MNSSTQISNLAASLVKAQAGIGIALKDKNNPFFKSKYADLSSVVDAIKGPISENGLAYTQVLHDADNCAKVETIIIHSSGEWMSAGTIAVPVSKNDAQGYGSAITYARRYSLSAAFGVVADDDDGNAAAAAAPAKKPEDRWTSPKLDALKLMNEDQMGRIRKCVSSTFDFLNAEDVEGACSAIDKEDFDAEEKVALWTFFDSKQRSAMKKVWEARRKAAAKALNEHADANHVATQA